MTAGSTVTGGQPKCPGQTLIAVGRLTRPVGLKGEMALEPLVDDRERLTELGESWIGRAAEAAKGCRVEHVRFTNAAAVVKISGIESRTEAEQHRGEYVFVDERTSAGPAPGSFYVHDIIGLDVFREDGTYIGTVKDVQKSPAHDLWIVARSGREFMIPAVRAFIRSVELDRRRVVIRPIEGLIDEN